MNGGGHAPLVQLHKKQDEIKLQVKETEEEVFSKTVEPPSLDLKSRLWTDQSVNQSIKIFDLATFGSFGSEFEEDVESNKQTDQFSFRLIMPGFVRLSRDKSFYLLLISKRWCTNHSAEPLVKWKMCSLAKLELESFDRPGFQKSFMVI